jgi:hypothetical protein
MPAIGSVQAMYAYEATNDEELTMADDDILETLDTDDPDWILVRKHEQVGFVPTSYVQPIIVPYQGDHIENGNVDHIPSSPSTELPSSSSAVEETTNIKSHPTVSRNRTD